MRSIHIVSGVIKPIMRILNLFSNSVHPVLVHDGVAIFRANQLALDLFGYASLDEIAAVGITGIVAPESQWLSRKRVEQLRKHPDQDLADAELIFIRKNGTRFVVDTHTKTLDWAMLEEDDRADVMKHLGTDILFYSWVGDAIQELV